MKEIISNIWAYASKGVIVIPTNGFVKSNGRAVMGRGLALDASTTFPMFSLELGNEIMLHGNHVVYWQKYELVTFPVKHNWWEIADLKLIAQSAEELRNLHFKKTLYMPRVGCGNGKLDWTDVKPILEKYLGNFDVVICDRVGEQKVV